MNPFSINDNVYFIHNGTQGILEMCGSIKTGTILKSCKTYCIIKTKNMIYSISHAFVFYAKKDAIEYFSRIIFEKYKAFGMPNHELEKRLIEIKKALD